MNDISCVEFSRLQDAAGSRWFFYPTPEGWRWDHVAPDGRLIAQAEDLFPSRTSCVSDARANGYAPLDGERCTPHGRAAASE